MNRMFRIGGLLLILFFAVVPIAEAIQATLTWTLPVDPNRTGVKVLRRDGVDANPFIQQGATLGVAVTTFNQGGLVTGTRYCYEIVTTGALGDAPPAGPVCGTPDLPLPASGLSIIFAP